MPVKESSRSAYMGAVLSGQTRSYRERIVDILELNSVPMSRRQIHIFTRGAGRGPEIPINAIPRATADLMEEDRIHVAFCDTDPGTGRRVEFLAPGPPPHQPRLL